MSVKNIKRLVLLLNLMLLAGTVAAAGVTVVSFADAGERQRRKTRPKNRNKSQNTLNPVKAKPLGAFSAIWNLQASPGAGPIAPPDDEPDTARDEAQRLLSATISILGVIPNVTTPSKGWAILAAGRNTKDTTEVTTGDIFLGAVVERIQRDGIFFSFRSHKGLFLAYVIVSQGSRQRPGPSRTGRGVSVRSGNPLRPGQGITPGPKGATSENAYDKFTTRKISENQWQLDRREKDFIFQNQAHIRAEARLAPHYNPKTAKADGVEIRGADKNTLVYKRGFRKADVIKSVNGVPVTGPQSIEALTKRFKNSRKVTITFERRGVTKTVTFNLK
jgi:hypothetical protein